MLCVVTALSLMSKTLGVGRQMILEAVCVMLVSLFLLEMVNMVKKQEDSRAGWAELCFDQVLVRLLTSFHYL